MSGSLLLSWTLRRAQFHMRAAGIWVWVSSCWWDLTCLGRPWITFWRSSVYLLWSESSKEGGNRFLSSAFWWRWRSALVMQSARPAFLVMGKIVEAALTQTCFSMQTLPVDSSFWCLYPLKEWYHGQFFTACTLSSIFDLLWLCLCTLSDAY